MKQFKKIIMITLAVCLFAACDSEGGSDVIWDVSPVEFNIFIADSDGQDLLDSTRQNNLIKDITVSYQGETYPVLTEREFNEKQYGSAQTRAYMPLFYGLILRQSWSHKTFTHGDFMLVFGEFDGRENINKREVTLHFPNGHQAVLSYSNSFEWKSNGEPKKSTVFYLDGKELKDNAGKGGIYHFHYSEAQGLEYVPGDIK